MSATSTAGHHACTLAEAASEQGRRRGPVEVLEVSTHMWSRYPNKTEGTYKATWKREFKLPWRKAGLLISKIKWTRTSRMSTKISLSTQTKRQCKAAPDANFAPPQNVSSAHKSRPRFVYERHSRVLEPLSYMWGFTTTTFQKRFVTG